LTSSEIACLRVCVCVVDVCGVLMRFKRNARGILIIIRVCWFGGFENFEFGCFRLMNLTFV